jgi:hypothetical protein
VKKLLLIWLVALGALEARGQVFLDFMINNKTSKFENVALRYISINVSHQQNWNQVMNGRGGGTLVIDVRALREPERKYSYREIAEKIYVPATITGPRLVSTPEFLLEPPPRKSFFMPFRRQLVLDQNFMKL